jgi:hypothetical protein
MKCWITSQALSSWVVTVNYYCLTFTNQFFHESSQMGSLLCGL